VELKAARSAAFDRRRQSNAALLGWARKNQIELAPATDPGQLVKELPGGRYVVWQQGNLGSPTTSCWRR
jgi:hypothetical protein